MRSYIYIRYLSPQSDAELLAGRCLRVLHSYLMQHPKVSIGVSFPGWSQKTVGLGVTFISSDASCLVQLAKQPYFTRMVDLGLFHISDVSEVPEHCREVQFIRNQRIAKQSPRALATKLRRLERRAIARGDRYFLPASEKSQHQMVGHYHVIPMTSSVSPEHPYALFVQCISVLGMEGGTFNNYGLGSPQAHMASVPMVGGKQ